MAKVVNGLLVGRIGNLVYYVINGVQYARVYVQPNNPKTPNQQAHRKKVKICTKTLQSFWPVIKIGYQSKDIAIKKFNEAFNYHRDNAMEEFKLPDSNETSFRLIPEKVKLAIGLINQPEIYSCQRNDHQIEITWNSELGPMPNLFTDMIVTTAYIPGRKAFTEFHTGTRKDGGGLVELPSDYNEPVHLWVFYWNPEEKRKELDQRVSNSVYLGVF